MMKFLNQTNLKLWHMAAAFLISTVFSVLINQYLDERQVVAEQRVNEVNAFLESTREFETLTRNYVVKINKDNKADPVAREALIANVQRQYSILDAAEGYLPAPERQLAQAYRGELVKLVRELGESEDIPSTREFFVELNSTLVRRKMVISALRRAADLPSDELTTAVGRDV